MRLRNISTLLSFLICFTLFFQAKAEGEEGERESASEVEVETSYLDDGESNEVLALKKPIEVQSEWSEGSDTEVIAFTIYDYDIVNSEYIQLVYKLPQDSYYADVLVDFAESNAVQTQSKSEDVFKQLIEHFEHFEKMVRGSCSKSELGISASDIAILSRDEVSLLKLITSKTDIEVYSALNQKNNRALLDIYDRVLLLLSNKKFYSVSNEQGLQRVQQAQSFNECGFSLSTSMSDLPLIRNYWNELAENEKFAEEEIFEKVLNSNEKKLDDYQVSYDELHRKYSENLMDRSAIEEFFGEKHLEAIVAATKVRDFIFANRSEFKPDVFEIEYRHKAFFLDDGDIFFANKQNNYSPSYIVTLPNLGEAYLKFVVSGKVNVCFSGEKNCRLVSTQEGIEPTTKVVKINDGFMLIDQQTLDAFFIEKSDLGKMMLNKACLARDTSIKYTQKYGSYLGGVMWGVIGTAGETAKNVALFGYNELYKPIMNDSEKIMESDFNDYNYGFTKNMVSSIFTMAHDYGEQVKNLGDLNHKGYQFIPPQFKKDVNHIVSKYGVMSDAEKFKCYLPIGVEKHNKKLSH